MKLLTITGQSFSGKKSLVQKLLSAPDRYEQIHEARPEANEDALVGVNRAEIERIGSLGKTAILMCPPRSLTSILAADSQRYPLSVTSLYVRLPKSVACERMAHYLLSAIDNSVPLPTIKQRLSHLLKKEDVTNILPLGIKVDASIKLKPNCQDTRISLTKYLSSRLQEIYESATFMRKDTGEYRYLYQHAWPDIHHYDIVISAEDIESATRPIVREIDIAMSHEYQNQA